MDNDNSKHERTKLGAWLYSWVTKASIGVGERGWLYWALNLTWGLLMTAVGYAVSLALLIAGKERYGFARSKYQVIGGSWGGLSIGVSSFVDGGESAYTLRHEFGHTCQNAVLGPFFPFLVAIPSAVRYWYRRAKNVSSPSYYAIWFEGSASDAGTEVVRRLNSK